VSGLVVLESAEVAHDPPVIVVQVSHAALAGEVETAAELLEVVEQAVQAARAIRGSSGPWTSSGSDAVGDQNDLSWSRTTLFATLFESIRLG
jgi:hypothetical protein